MLTKTELDQIKKLLDGSSKKLKKELETQEINREVEFVEIIERLERLETAIEQLVDALANKKQIGDFINSHEVRH